MIGACQMQLARMLVRGLQPQTASPLPPNRIQTYAEADLGGTEDCATITKNSLSIYVIADLSILMYEGERHATVHPQLQDNQHEGLNLQHFY
jgi:hypothetical protein